MPMYVVYILYSKKLNRFYTGTTDDFERRLAEHNSNKYDDGFTSRGIPWELFFAKTNQIDEFWRIIRVNY